MSGAVRRRRTGVVVVVWRFVTGAPLLSGVRVTNSTFFRRATRVAAGARPSRWAMAAGWLRAAVRLAVVAIVAGWFLARVLTIAVVAASAAVAAVVVWRSWCRRRYEAAVLRPLFDGLAPILGLQQDARVTEWLSVPMDTDSDSPVLVGLPRAFPAGPSQVKEITAMVNRRLPGGPWEAHLRARDFLIEYRHAPEPPADVWYRDAPAERLELVPIGQDYRHRWVTIDLAAQTPHVLMSASTGWGKTVTANVLAAHVCRFGGLVDILDPKRIGYLDAFDGLPNVRIHTEIDGMIAAIDEFRAEMENRYRLIEARQAKEGDFQPRVLLDDEKGSLTVAIRQWWKADGGKGEAPPLTSQRVILWQGRAAQMYVFTFCQQANLNVIPDSDMRDQYGFRIASGPQSLSSWRMMFSGPKLRITKRKGRAHVAVGADDPTPVQLARITPQEARDLAAAGVSHPAVAARRPADRPAAVPGPARPALAPAERPALRLVAGAAVAELDGGHRAGDQVDDLVVGLAAAAELLGMNVEAFRKARRRRPIEGETRAAGQPAFPPSELRAWQSRRKIAGRRSES